MSTKDESWRWLGEPLQEHGTDEHWAEFADETMAGLPADDPDFAELSEE